MYNASYDGINYIINDESYMGWINKGLAEPYTFQLSIIKTYLDETEKKGLRRNRTYIDIGAHCGTTILPYSRIFNNIFGYEPNKENFDICLENIKRNYHIMEENNSKCTVKNLAISDDICPGELVLEPGANKGMYYFKKKENGDVKTVRIDDETYSENGEYDTLGPIDFVKIDTEGYELSVLKSAENTLKKWKPLLLIETNGWSESHYGVKNEEIIKYVLSLGYSYFTLNDQVSKDIFNSYFW